MGRCRQTGQMHGTLHASCRAEDNVREPLDHVHGLARVGHIRLVAQRLCW